MSSGVVASEEVQSNFLRAELLGKTKSDDYIENRVRNNNVGFYDVIKKNNLKMKTCSTLKHVKKMNLNGKDVIIKADRSCFARTLYKNHHLTREKKHQYTRLVELFTWSYCLVTGNSGR